MESIEVAGATLPPKNRADAVRMLCGESNRREYFRWSKWICGVCLPIGFLLVVILVPLSLSSVEYYEYGLIRKRSSGKMLLEKGVYDAGRYSLGPDRTFKKFQADAHYLNFDELSVFSSAKLETLLGIRIVYFLRKEELVELHNTFDRSYRPVVQGQIIGAIKNASPQFSTTAFFQKRRTIEKALLQAVRNATESVFVDVARLMLLRVEIPDKIKDRQLNVAIQLEDNAKEEFMQRSQLIRQNTSFLVNEIENKANIVKEKARSEAKLLTEKAKADSAFLVEEARFKGLSSLFDALNISTPKDKTTLDFLKALEANDKAGVYFNFNNLFITSPQLNPPPQ
ncbi:hypothetical protein BSKO_05683 [Bryopsis sp. KO-2023]|nr:hypothetical protein BSKO_05683 [Bryopsis sp. KO-2023]